MVRVSLRFEERSAFVGRADGADGDVPDSGLLERLDHAREEEVSPEGGYADREVVERSHGDTATAPEVSRKVA